jgi:S-adenosylhomocysteine hydrolase
MVGFSLLDRCLLAFYWLSPCYFGQLGLFWPHPYTMTILASLQAAELAEKAVKAAAAVKAAVVLEEEVAVLASIQVVMGAKVVWAEKAGMVDKAEPAVKAEEVTCLVDKEEVLRSPLAHPTLLSQQLMVTELTAQTVLMVGLAELAELVRQAQVV